MRPRRPDDTRGGPRSGTIGRSDAAHPTPTVDHRVRQDHAPRDGGHRGPRGLVRAARRHPFAHRGLDHRTCGQRQEHARGELRRGAQLPRRVVPGRPRRRRHRVLLPLSGPCRGAHRRGGRSPAHPRHHGPRRLAGLCAGVLPPPVRRSRGRCGAGDRQPGLQRRAQPAAALPRAWVDAGAAPLRRAGHQPRRAAAGAGAPARQRRHGLPGRRRTAAVAGRDADPGRAARAPAGHRRGRPHAGPDAGLGGGHRADARARQDDRRIRHAGRRQHPRGAVRLPGQRDLRPLRSGRARGAARDRLPAAPHGRDRGRDQRRRTCRTPAAQPVAQRLLRTRGARRHPARLRDAPAVPRVPASHRGTRTARGGGAAGPGARCTTACPGRFVRRCRRPVRAGRRLAGDGRPGGRAGRCTAGPGPPRHLARLARAFAAGDPRGQRRPAVRRRCVPPGREPARRTPTLRAGLAAGPRTRRRRHAAPRLRRHRRGHRQRIRRPRRARPLAGRTGHARRRRAIGCTHGADVGPVPARPGRADVRRVVRRPVGR